MLVEEIIVKEWDLWHYKTHLFRVVLSDEQEFREIAEELKVPFIFKKGEELMCTDGVLLYFYRS